MATMILTTIGGAFVWSRPTQVVLSGFFGGMIVAPTTWWFSLQGKNGKLASPNIFYQNDCTQADVDRFRHQDMIEEAAELMKTQPGYGHHIRGDQISL